MNKYIHEVPYIVGPPSVQISFCYFFVLILFFIQKVINMKVFLLETKSCCVCIHTGSLGIYIYII